MLLWSYGQRRYKEVEGALQGSKCCTGAERHANRNAHGHADTGNINYMEHQASLTCGDPASSSAMTIVHMT